MVSLYPLFDYSSDEWKNLCQFLTSSQHIASLEELEHVFEHTLHREIHVFRDLARELDEERLLCVGRFLIEHALLLPLLFPQGSIERLSSESDGQKCLKLTRLQILVLLSHMTLCTLRPTSVHRYWVTFENWLCDGRACAMAYVRALIGYLEACRDLVESDWSTEVVSFERHSCPENVLDRWHGNRVEIPTVRLDGRIGDFSSVIVDFANCDIGFGIFGTQEEILFGSHVELCVAMLFSDTMLSDEAICIRNVFKYAEFSGYGASLLFSHMIPRDERRVYTVIAVDAIDFSEEEGDTLALQLKISSLERELKKLIAGFSSVESLTIDTGNWGCGAFGGNAAIKASLQIIAASCTRNQLSWCCFHNLKFYERFCSFIHFLEDEEISPLAMWKTLTSLDPSLISEETIFDTIQSNLMTISS